jgi:hypothetical protein
VRVSPGRSTCCAEREGYCCYYVPSVPVHAREPLAHLLHLLRADLMIVLRVLLFFHDATRHDQRHDCQ